MADLKLANLNFSEEAVEENSQAENGLVQNGLSERSMMATEIRYYEENGRLYQNTEYFAPMDEDEQLRQTIMHQFYLNLTRAKLFLAPIATEQLHTVLDVGTGTGDWAMAMAEHLPDCQIIGSDISAIQPDAVPENLEFEVDDAAEEWLWSERFDLVHFRGLAGAFKDWDHLYHEALKHLRPGGYVEVVDIEPSDAILATSDSLYAEFQQSLIDCARQSGRPLTLEHMHRSSLERAGFEHIKVEQQKVALGPWPSEAKKKALGKLFLVCKLEGLEAEGLRLLTRHAGWTADEVRARVRAVQAELMSGEHRHMMTVRFLIGRKPRAR